MGLFPVLFWATAHAISEPRAELRSSCDSEAATIATANQGDPVEIRFALSGEIGTCYKVVVMSGGKTLQGYLPAKSLSSIDRFDEARRSAASLDTARRREEISSVHTQARATARSGDAAAKASELLAVNQPAEALTIIEKALMVSRRDAGMLAMAGLAAYQADRPKEAVAYLEESLALSRQPQVERLLDRARREVDADQSSRKLVGIRFNFRYDDRTVTPEQAAMLLPVLDSEFTRVSEQLGCRAEERITAVIQGREDYQRTTGAAEWSAGQYDGRIRVALLEPSPGRETQRAFAHEIVHACLGRIGHWPAWLHEGLAQKLSGDVLPSHLREQARQAARSGQLPPLAAMGASWSRLSTRHAQTAYATALIAADILYEAYGSAGVRSLLQNPAMLDRVTSDLDRRLRE